MVQDRAVIVHERFLDFLILRFWAFWPHRASQGSFGDKKEWFCILKHALIPLNTPKHPQIPPGGQLLWYRTNQLGCTRKTRFFHFEGAFWPGLPYVEGCVEGEKTWFWVLKHAIVAPNALKHPQIASKGQQTWCMTKQSQYTSDLSIFWFCDFEHFGLIGAS